MEGVVIALSCVIFSLFASSPPEVEAGVSAAAAVWCYLGAVIFNLLVLTGAVRMSDRVVKELVGL